MSNTKLKIEANEMNKPGMNKPGYTVRVNEQVVYIAVERFIAEKVAHAIRRAFEIAKIEFEREGF